MLETFFIVIICILFIVFQLFIERHYKNNQDKIKHAITKAELIIKIKQGNFTDNELDYILSSNKDLRAIFQSSHH